MTIFLNISVFQQSITNKQFDIDFLKMSFDNGGQFSGGLVGSKCQSKSSGWAKITFHLVGGKDNFSSCWAKITFQVSDFVTKYSVTSLQIALSFSFEFD